MTRSVVIFEDDGWFVAEDIISGVASQGRTISEASSNLREALELYFEDNECDTEEEPHFVLDPEGESIQNGHSTTESAE